MRPYCVLVLALAILLATTNATIASARTKARSPGTFSDKSINRHLRELAAENPDQDENSVATTAKIWWMKFVATMTETRLTKKHEGMLKSWLQNPDMTPTDAYKILNLDTLGGRASESPNFKVYKTYTSQLVARWVKDDAQPTTVYKSLRLGKDPDTTSPNFAVYEQFRKARST